MRLKTIWGLPLRQSKGGYSLRERLSRTGELWWYYTAPKLLPRRLRYGVLIHEGVRQIRHDEEVPAVPFTEVLKRTGEEMRAA